MLIRIITDGKAGDLVQCLGVAEQVIAQAGGSIEERMVRPRFLYSLAMPWGPADPRDAAAVAEPFPNIAIASGRRAVASLRLLKRRAPNCFTVFLKDPRTGPSSADLIWVPAHDRLRGPNVVTSMTSPHRITTEKLNAASAIVRADILRVAKPRVAVLVGGASRDVPFERADRQRLLSDLILLARSGAGLMVTPSRRTPAEFVAQLQEALVPLGAWIWDGEGDNPYLELLALADQVVVTADSANMVGEAAATGRPILVFEPVGLPAKLRRFLGMLVAHGAVAKFHGRLENLDYDPLDSTPLIAREILERYHRGPSR